MTDFGIALGLFKELFKKKKNIYIYTLAYTSYLRCHLCFLQPANG